MRRRPAGPIVPIVVFLLVLATAACGGDGGGEAPACERAVETTSVTMRDFSYEPTCVAAGSGAELAITNEGQAPHTFTIESDADTAELDLPAGERGTLRIPELEAGTYEVTCTYHPQMVAALRIVPA